MDEHCQKAIVLTAQLVQKSDEHPLFINEIDCYRFFCYTIRHKYSSYLCQFYKVQM
jgi:hypothetical protein